MFSGGSSPALASYHLNLDEEASSTGGFCKRAQHGSPRSKLTYGLCTTQPKELQRPQKENNKIRCYFAP
jgi:hypothetical protein